MAGVGLVGVGIFLPVALWSLALEGLALGWAMGVVGVGVIVGGPWRAGGGVRVHWRAY